MIGGFSDVVFRRVTAGPVGHFQNWLRHILLIGITRFPLARFPLMHFSTQNDNFFQTWPFWLKAEQINLFQSIWSDLKKWSFWVKIAVIAMQCNAISMKVTSLMRIDSQYVLNPSMCEVTNISFNIHIDGFTTYWLSIHTMQKMHCIVLQWQLFSLKMTIFSNLTKLIEKG